MLTQPHSRPDETIYVAAAVTIFVVSSLLTACCIPQLPDLLCSWTTMQRNDNAHVRNCVRYSFVQSFSEHFHSIRVANIK